MKKMLTTLLLAALLLGLATGASAGSGWTFLTPPEASTPDNMQLGAAAAVENFGSLTLTDFSFEDRLGYYRQGAQSVGGSGDYYSSGADAEYALVHALMMNTTGSALDYLSDAKVTLSDGKNLYGGWAMQQRRENGSATDAGYGEDSGVQNQRWVIDAADQFPIEPYGHGYYVFGCTLPNAVVSGGDPLTMTITLGGNDFVYHIRQAQQTAAPTSAPTFAPMPTFAPTPVPQATRPPERYYVVSNSGDSYVRSGPGLGYTKLGVLRKGKSADYLNKSSTDDRGVTWYNIEYNGNSAWVSSRYTTLKSAGTGSSGGNAGGTGGNTGGSGGNAGGTASGYVKGMNGNSYVRSGPGLSYPKMGLLKKGQTAPYLGEKSTDNRGVVWYKIRFDGEVCWVSSRYTSLQ